MCMFGQKNDAYGKYTGLHAIVSNNTVQQKYQVVRITQLLWCNRNLFFNLQYDTFSLKYKLLIPHSFPSSKLYKNEYFFYNYNVVITALQIKNDQSSIQFQFYRLTRYQINVIFKGVSFLIRRQFVRFRGKCRKVLLYMYS